MLLWLWLGPLIATLLALGTLIGTAWFFSSPKDRRPRITRVVAVPLGCAVFPILCLLLLAAVGSFFQKSDVQLFKEVFGYTPTITEDRMLFDDFGSGTKREIFLKAEPRNNERKRLLKIAGLVQSDFTLDQFIARGAQHGFSWWISADQDDSRYCKSARILDAHGFRGWVEFRIAECLDAGAGPFAHKGLMYVVASGRQSD